MMIPYVAWEAFSAIANRLDLHIITRISAVARNQVGGSICERMSVLSLNQVCLRVTGVEDVHMSYLSF